MTEYFSLYEVSGGWRAEERMRWRKEDQKWIKKKKIVGMEENGKIMSQKQFEKKDIRAKNGIKRGR